LPSVAQERILGRYPKCETLPWGPGVVIPLLLLPRVETHSRRCCAHLCPLLKAGVRSASAVGCPCFMQPSESNSSPGALSKRKDRVTIQSRGWARVSSGGCLPTCLLEDRRLAGLWFPLEMGTA